MFESINFIKNLDKLNQKYENKSLKIIDKNKYTKNEKSFDLLVKFQFFNEKKIQYWLDYYEDIELKRLL